MFFGNNTKKDKKIAELEARIRELESNQSNENQILEEINDVLSKAAKGLCEVKVNGNVNNPKINQIKNSINQTLEYYQNFKNQSEESLKKCNNAKFSYEKNSNDLTSVSLGIKTLGDSISELLSLINRNSNELNNQAQELSSVSSILSNTTHEQKASIEETSIALEKVTSTIKSNNENSNKMASYANGVINSAKLGQDMSNQTDKAMDEINDQVTAINEAITIIDQIAFQTNILSLNAAVEAATAGEAGKGFAVVAGEVRNLANRSAEAAKEIKDLVESANNKTQNGKDVAFKMTQGYEKLYENINNTIELIQDVSNASKEQHQAIEEINYAISKLDQTTKQNSTSAEQINSQSRSIYELSEELINITSNKR